MEQHIGHQKRILAYRLSGSVKK